MTGRLVNNRLGALWRATETRVVLSLLAGIALVDLGLRLADQRLSGNLAHIAEIPELIAGAGVPAQRSLLLLGNSLTNNGIAAPIVHATLPHFLVAKVTPDATNVWDWQCLLDHQVVERREVQYDTVVIGFAWHLLSDQARMDASRLGALYCHFDDLTRAGDIGLRNSADIGEFIAARVLRTYALRDTLRNRFFQMVVPNYVEMTQSGNAAHAGIAEPSAAHAAKPTTAETHHTYRILASLIDRLRSKGTQVVVVAMPVQTPYEIDPELRALEKSESLRVIDLRKVTGLDASHYVDDMHLNAAGQRILSRELAEDLHAVLTSAT